MHPSVIVRALENLAASEALKRNTGFQFKMAMYRKAARLFKNSKASSLSPNEADALLAGGFKNPTKIREKLSKLFNAKLDIDPNELATLRTINQLSSVPQIGPIKAKALIASHGIESVESLINAVKNNPKLITPKQKLGLKYYRNLIDPSTLNAKRIPRDEIIHFEKLLRQHTPLEFTICGSYRRGASTSGDIDVLVTCSVSEFEALVTSLKKINAIGDHFSSGKTKWMGVGKIDKLYRRIDLMRVSAEEYPFAILYFTGSKEFNEALRGHARKLGYSLNEHGIKKIGNTNLVQNHKFTTESSIMQFLNIPYHEPEMRNHGKFQISKKAKSKRGNDTNASKVVYDVGKGVLLATVYKNDIDPTGFHVSEKYDGIRAIWNGIQLRSRQDKIIAAPEWFTDDLPKDVAIDGELFIARGQFQKTTSVVMKKTPIEQEWKLVKFMVFDVPSINAPFEERMSVLKKLKLPSHVHIVQHTQVHSKKHMKQVYDAVMKSGGEGVMLRKAQSNYKPTRSSILMKVKPTDDAEAIVTNSIEGKGKDSGSLGALVVKLLKNDTKKFKIGTGFTSALRKQLWTNKEALKGKVVTFGFKGFTDGGKPRHPAFMRFRENI